MTNGHILSFPCSKSQQEFSFAHFQISVAWRLSRTLPARLQGPFPATSTASSRGGKNIELKDFFWQGVCILRMFGISTGQTKNQSDCLTLNHKYCNKQLDFGHVIIYIYIYFNVDYNSHFKDRVLICASVNGAGGKMRLKSTLALR